MLANATRICEANFGMMYRYDNGAFHPAALLNVPPALAKYVENRGSFLPPTGTPLDRLFQTREVTYTADETAESNPGAPARLGGARSLVGVPMLKENELVGAIIIYRQEVRPFTDKQVELVRSFASQAVIAIENTRLLKELRESLQQQTATADCSRSSAARRSICSRFSIPIVQTASRLCDAEYATIYGLKDDHKYHVVANNGADPVFLKYASEHPLAPERGSLVGRTALGRKTVHMPDCLADKEYVALEYQSVGRYRSMLGVPLLREGVPIGVIALMRTAVLPFTDNQVEHAAALAPRLGRAQTCRYQRPRRREP